MHTFFLISVKMVIYLSAIAQDLTPWLPVSGHCLARPPHRGIRGVSFRHWLLSHFLLRAFCEGGGPARLPNSRTNCPDWPCSKPMSDLFVSEKRDRVIWGITSLTC